MREKSLEYVFASQFLFVYLTPTDRHCEPGAKGKESRGRTAVSGVSAPPLPSVGDERLIPWLPRVGWSSRASGSLPRLAWTQAPSGEGFVRAAPALAACGPLTLRPCRYISGRKSRGLTPAIT